MADELIPSNLLRSHVMDWYEANLRKNSETSAERKAATQVEKEFGDTKDTITVNVSDTLDIIVGTTTEEDEMIDPQLVLKRYGKEVFDSLVQIPSGNLKAIYGDKGVALCSVKREVTKFRIKKVKKVSTRESENDS